MPVVATPTIPIDNSSAPQASVFLGIDFDDDGNVEDYTADLMDFRMIRGREEELERAEAGTLELRMDNSSGKFSVTNSSSPLFGQLDSGKTVQITASHEGISYVIFVGEIERIVSHPHREEQDAYIYVVDGMDFLARAKVDIAFAQARATELVVGDILTAAGWPSGDRVLSTGQGTFSIVPFFREFALVALNECEDVERGFFYVAHDGDALFEDRHYRLRETRSNTVQATLTDKSKDIEFERSTRSLYNEVNGELVVHDGPQSLTPVARLVGENPLIVPGQTRVFFVPYDKISNGVLDPVKDTDIQASASAGGGNDKNSDLTITATHYAKGTKLSLQNTGAASIFISDVGTVADAFQIRGTPFNEKSGQKIIAEDTVSQGKYQIRSLDINGKYFADTNDLQNVVDKALTKYRNPQDLVRITLTNDSDATLLQILRRRISDRVKIINTKLGLSDEFYIEKIEIHIWEARKFYECTWTLSLASNEDYWVLDVSKLDKTTRLF